LLREKQCKNKIIFAILQTPRGVFHSFV